jgi:hypothetical protein
MKYKRLTMFLLESVWPVFILMYGLYVGVKMGYINIGGPS